jgi:peptidoglycan/LPS O-acetylase OafA/YrhL
MSQTAVVQQIQSGSSLNQPSAFSGRIPELDGVRALAIWMVLGAHLFYAFPNAAGTFASVPSSLQQLVGHGWL